MATIRFFGLTLDRARTLEFGVVVLVSGAALVFADLGTLCGIASAVGAAASLVGVLLFWLWREERQGGGMLRTFAALHICGGLLLVITATIVAVVQALLA
jgi:hypothetical protein